MGTELGTGKEKPDIIFHSSTYHEKHKHDKDASHLKKNSGGEEGKKVDNEAGGSGDNGESIATKKAAAQWGKMSVKRAASRTRTKLRQIFDEADTSTQGSLSQGQFTTSVLKHGAELGHLWTPSEIRESFHAAKTEGGSWYSRRGGRINFNGFVAVVVKHMDKSKKRQRRLSQARGVDLRLLSLQQQAAKEGRDYNEITHMDKWVATLVSFFYLLYPVLTKASFALVGCHYVGEKSYVQMDMQVPCWDWNDMEHINWVFALFFPSLILYVVGLPVFGIYLLHKVRKRLDHDKHQKFRYSVLLVGYRSSTYYWEGVIAVRKALVIGTSVFLVQAGPRWQTLVAQALNAILLIVHTQFRPFERVNKQHDTLHNADFFALSTSFITLTSGIYLFQSVGSNNGFQIFLQIVVVGANVLFMFMAVYWYLTLRLFDMGNALANEETNKEFTARFVLCLQRYLPDWREQSIKDEMEEADRLEHQAMGRANLIHLLTAKKVAAKWISKTKLHKIKKEARALEESYEEDHSMLVKRLESLKNKAHGRLDKRIQIRRASMSNLTTPPMKTKIAATEAGESSVIAAVAVVGGAPPPPPRGSSGRGSSGRGRGRRWRGERGRGGSRRGRGERGRGGQKKSSRRASVGDTPMSRPMPPAPVVNETPKFQTVSSEGKMHFNDPKCTETGKEAKQTKPSSSSSPAAVASVPPRKTTYMKVIKGMKVKGLGFRLRPPNSKTEGHCWVSNLDFSSPAAQAGVRENDMVVMVGDISMHGMVQTEVVDALRRTKKPFEIAFQSYKKRRDTNAWRESHYHITELKEKEEEERARAAKIFT